MPQYIRAYVPGGSFFFTVNLADRHRRLLIEHLDLLKRCFAQVRERLPFHTEAIVVLPDHLHCIWTLPPGDADFSTRWRLLKAGFARALPTMPGESIPRVDKREHGIWQRRFWEHCLRDETDWQAHVDYIHFNPVKHGYVKQPGL